MLFKVNSCIEINEQKFITKYVHLLNQKDYTQIPRELSSNSLHFIYSFYKKRLSVHLINDYYCFISKGRRYCQNFIVPFSDNKGNLNVSDVCGILSYMKNFGDFNKHEFIMLVFLSDELCDFFETSKDYKLIPFFDEFIYKRTSVIDMKGHAWKRKRNIISRFTRNYSDVVVRTATINDLNKILNLRNAWRVKKQQKKKIFDDSSFMLEIEFLLSDFGKQFGELFVCEIDGNIAACCSVCHLCNNTVYTGHNNYLSEYVGINEFLYKEVLMRSKFTGEYVNDGGVKLNDPCYVTKMHYNPIHINRIGAIYVR